jgi:DnaJ-domain-containing protein 1
LNEEDVRVELHSEENGEDDLHREKDGDEPDKGAAPWEFDEDDEDGEDEDVSSDRNEGGERDSKAWWNVLEVTLQASDEQIKAAYRSKMKSYHPDRLEGLADELKKLAERRAKQLNQAYEAAKMRAKSRP